MTAKPTPSTGDALPDATENGDNPLDLLPAFIFYRNGALQIDVRGLLTIISEQAETLEQTRQELAARVKADAPIAGKLEGLIEQLRSPKQWNCIFEYEGAMRHGKSDAPYKAATVIASLQADNARKEAALRGIKERHGWCKDRCRACEAAEAALNPERGGKL